MAQRDGEDWREAADEDVGAMLGAFAERHLRRLAAGDMRGVRDLYDDKTRIYLEQNGEVIVATGQDILAMAEAITEAHGPNHDPDVRIHHTHIRDGFGVLDVEFHRADGTRVRGLYLGRMTPDGPRLVAGLIRHMETGA